MTKENSYELTTEETDLILGENLAIATVGNLAKDVRVCYAEDVAKLIKKFNKTGAKK